MFTPHECYLQLAKRKKNPLEKAQELAGHKWPGITEKYIKVDSLQQRESINRFFSLYIDLKKACQNKMIGFDFLKES